MAEPYEDPLATKRKRPGPMPAETGAPNPSDPFASMGGGVQLAGGEWVPQGHPLAAQSQPQAAPIAPVEPPPATSAPATPQATSVAPSAPPTPTPNPADPFAAIGGGVQLPTGEWVPAGHPLAQAASAAPAAAPAATVAQAAPAASADPFASVGGGVQLPTGEWVPRGTAEDPWKGVGADVVAATPLGMTSPPPTTAPPLTETAPLAPTAPIGDPRRPETTAPPAPAETVAPPADVAAPDAMPTIDTKFRDALMKMLDVSDPSLDDPALKAQSDAFSLAQTRARDRARSAMAERRAQQGMVDSGAFDRDLVGLFQQQGEAEGAFNANLLGGELQNRRNQLLQAATIAGNQMNAEDARALQQELAQLDAAIRREGMAQQGSQFGQSLAQQTSQFGQSLAEQKRQADIEAQLKRLGIDLQGELGRADVGLRGELGRGQLNLGLLSNLLQNQQFGQRLGADVGMFNSNQNTQALLNMLGML